MTLEELLAEGTTIAEVVEEFDVPYNTAKETLLDLHKTGTIKIIDWDLNKTRDTYIPIYGYGRADVKMPTTDHFPVRNWLDKIWFGETGVAEPVLEESV
jgi:transcription initiation factor TFIID subunit TAF12